jgi:ATP-dependent protease ClpP protease subunit
MRNRPHKRSSEKNENEFIFPVYHDYIDSFLEERGILYLTDQNDELPYGRSVSRLIKVFHKMVLTPSIDEIRVYINCSGGSVVDLLAFYDAIRIVNRSTKKKVTTIASGKVYSGALFVLEAGHQRYATEHSEFMIHDFQLSQVDGALSDIDSFLAASKSYRHRAYAILAQRMNMKTSELIKEISKRGEWWFDAKTALKLGLVDSLIP